MKANINRSFIISELYPQHNGDIKILETMMLQSKFGGADAVKLQLYSSQLLFGDDRKQYAELTIAELKSLKKYAENIQIDIFASVFDAERIKWCEDLDIPYYKIASRSFDNEKLVNAVIQTGKPVFISNGLHQNDFRYQGENVHYFYCIPKYPALLEDVNFPDFECKKYEGYSDHCVGITASVMAMAFGAKYIEKHFTLSHSMQSNFSKANLCAMDIDELRQLAKFNNELHLMCPVLL